MARLLARQPNGRLCVFSTVTDCIIEHNLTDDDYVEWCAEQARKKAREQIRNDIDSYEDIIEKTQFRNMTEKEFLEIKKAMENEN